MQALLLYAVELDCTSDSAVVLSDAMFGITTSLPTTPFSSLELSEVLRRWPATSMVLHESSPFLSTVSPVVVGGYTVPGHPHDLDDAGKDRGQTGTHTLCEVVRRLLSDSKIAPEVHGCV